MSDLGWVVPAAIALLGVALLVAAIAIAVRLSRRSPRARAAASRSVSDSADALLRLDDAVNELDLAFRAADAVDVIDEPTELRRARAAALRARDRAFAEVSRLQDDTGLAARRRDEARRLGTQLDGQLERVARTRRQLDEWARTHRTGPELLAAARRRRDEVLETTGDPEQLLAVLRDRFAPEDRDDAETAGRAASDALRDADLALQRAASEPDGRDLFDATAALARAERQVRAVEDAHRIALQAAENAAAEVTAARAEIEAATEVATLRPTEAAPDAAEHLRAAARDLEAAAAVAAQRPRRAIAIVARVRERRDQTLSDAMTPRQRLEAARAALPGTLACARAALAVADARDSDAPIADRLQLERARRQLASARAATDAEQALAHARAAWHAVARPT
ncbi:hypothetical protein [Microbacterium testaceum]|uniref:hypothetical protein n=1 Tax=Microbacterium testaceum TaxID=2033 RepID=UPI002AC3A700|nr:hypothetical protein [Microbacterium testaceum]MDZ5145010.1 hypothetical protein [Microbacterium testaceum]